MGWSDAVESSALRLITVVLACLAWQLALPLPLAHAAGADSGANALAAGIQARSAHPPDLGLAHAHFEAAAASSDDWARKRRLVIGI